MKKKKKEKSLLKRLDKKFTSKKVLRKSQTSVVIPNYKAPSVLEDENRFFKGQFEKEKRSMYFE